MKFILKINLTILSFICQMKYFFYFLALLLFSCNSSTKPDVSNIEVNLKTERFDNDFFRIDTNEVSSSIQLLYKKYPGFTGGFVSNILGLHADSLSVGHSATSEAVRQFIKDYTPIKDSSDRIFKDFSKWTTKIDEALRYVKYYFPKYQLPEKVIVFIGPMDAFFNTSFGIQGDVLTPAGIGIGLQLHLGKDFSFYKSEEGQELYPEYISRSFDPEHIPINAMMVIIDDLYPPQNQSSTLIEQMVESGKKYFLLEKFLPDENESALFGYTEEQTKGVYKNEATIWDFFLNNNLINNNDPTIIKNYIGPSPKTQAFGDGAPGNLGSFIGLQIVKKFMEVNPKISLDQLMKMPQRRVYEQSKYKPRN